MATTSSFASTTQQVLRVADTGFDALASLTARFGATPEVVSDNEKIPGSFWGEPEAGLIGARIYLRPDTPVHSFLHELAHFVCMDGSRRASLDRDAGGDDAEEEAVCYLQLLLADAVPGVGRERVMRDMDAWGYSFRHGSTASWFARDGAVPRSWLQRHGIIDSGGRPTYRRRESRPPAKSTA